MPQHLILVGACYVDTVLSVPKFPDEDSKLRATRVQTRRGGNCPNSLEVLEQLVEPQDDLCVHLISCLPAKGSAATSEIISSFKHQTPSWGLAHCLYRENKTEPAGSYIIRSAETGSRTIISHNDLPEMEVSEFKTRMLKFDPREQTWWHFEGRIPATISRCIQLLRDFHPKARVSLEIERPGREGLSELAAQVDVVFYSRAWAEDRGHASPVECLMEELTPRAYLTLCTWGAGGAAALSRQAAECIQMPVRDPVTVVDTVGAGDTFVAALLYGLVCHQETWDTSRKLSIAVQLATAKVQQEGFEGLGSKLRRLRSLD